MVTTTTGLATSFITFSRPGASGGGATVTDRDGKIKWAGHNLLTNSESFDASAWVKVGVGITANTASAPDGTTTADTISWGAGGTVYMQQDINFAVGTVLTFSVWVRSASGSQTFRLYGDNTIFSSDFTATTTWQLFTHTYTVATGGGGRGCGIAPASGTSFSGFIWGAHLYRSDLGGMQANPAMPANMGSYYPTSVANRIGYSEDFANAAWTKDDILSVTSNATAGPNGLTTADAITPNTTSAVHQVRIGAIGVSASTPYTASVYVKPNGYTKVGLVENQTTGAYATFNCTGAGSVISNGLGGSGSITAVGNGFYRISLGMTTAVGQSTYRLDIRILPESFTSGAPSTSWSGDGVSGIYLWGAQLSDSASLDTYVPSYGAAVTSAAYYAPRLDYDPVTLAARGLLVEEQRTNFFLNSNAPSGGTGVTVTAGAAVSPDGTLSAYRIAKTDATSPRYIPRNTSMTAVGGTTYTVSTWFKYDGYDTVVSLEYNNADNFNLVWAAQFTVSITGVTTLSASNCTTSIQNVGNGWYRTVVTFTAGSSPASPTNPTVLTRITGASGVSVLGYGAQLEAGSFATSYIPTGSATATRTADVASVSVQAFPYSASEGTLVASGQSLTDAGFPYLAALNDGTSNNEVYLNFHQGLRAATVTGGVVQSYWTTSAAAGVNKLATAYKANDFGSAFNGTSNTTDTSGSVPPAATTLQIGRTPSLNGWVRQITYLPRRLTNAELAARTA